jgi:hypothetical protein
LLNGKIKKKIINYSLFHFFFSFGGNKDQLHKEP